MYLLARKCEVARKKKIEFMADISGYTDGKSGGSCDAPRPIGLLFNPKL
jgi:hypothetical protein